MLEPTTIPPAARAYHGARGAFIVLAPWTLLLVALWLIAGPEVPNRGRTIRVDLLTIAYPVGAALMGALAGLLHPWASKDRDNALVSGALAVAPWMAVIVWSLDWRSGRWSWFHTFIFAASTVAVGWQVARAYWRQHWEDDDSVPHGAA